jgi:TonB-linked SusC/RagA family outer membrane protein
MAKKKMYRLRAMLRATSLLITFGLLLQEVQAQSAKSVMGTVTDETNSPLPGVTIMVKGSTRGVMTDPDGSYSISVSVGGALVFSYLGMKTQEITVDERSEYNVQLKPQENEFEEVVVVAFATQKKESVISAITTVSPKELKVPSSNLTTALAGRMSGLIAYQQSGEPGNDNAQFFIRGVTTFGYKKDPLILIDNIELTSDDLARLNVDDIAQFSIMKDATATALYGARGANGVIIVTTKEGQAGKPKISVRYEHSISQPTQMVSVADPITYMRLNNEAVNTRRNPLNTSADAGYTVFSQSKIDNTIAGTNPYMYPAVDWYKELFNDYASTDRANLNLSGGSEKVRYYIAASFTKDNGVLKNEKLNNYNTNIDLRKYTVRSNTNIDLTNSTEVIIRVSGSFDDYVGPLNGGDQLFNKVIRTSPVLYPKSYPAVGSYAGSTHVLFGNTDVGNYLNPYADMVKGYKEYNRTTVVAQAEVKQKFDFLTEGMEARLMLSTTRYSYNDVLRYNVPFHYQAASYDPATDTYVLLPLNTDGQEYLGYYPGSKDMNTTNYIEGAMSYNRVFDDKHAVSAMLVYIQQENKTANAESLQLSLPRRNQGVSGRFTYAYDSRYFTEFNFGYNGSERFSINERYGFFPSMGLGYILSNESFWEPLLPVVDLLKLKFTYGLVGNDAIGDSRDRFYYLSEVNMDDGNRGQVFGAEYGNRLNGISNSRYPNPHITWETSRKSNLGLELGLFNKTLELQADLFYEYRSNIYMSRSYIPSSMGLSAGVSANVGEASSRGVDLSLTYSLAAGQNYWVKSMGNFTYAVGRYEVYEELDYAGLGEPWRTRVGQPINWNYGYIAERLFIDDYDIINSPTQTFGSYQAGDIKYRDINRDGVINFSDMVFIGYPNQPEITYGFGVSGGYKDFDLSLFFQGNARVTFFLDPNKITPFVDISADDKRNMGMDENKTAVNNLLSVIAEDHWSESNRNLYAFWPRLAPRTVSNNAQTSTWWMHDGSFMRLKTVELGYTLPAKLAKKLHMQSLRLYVTGNNLLTFSSFKLWDPEMGSNGLGYPIQRVYNIGINVNL